MAESPDQVAPSGRRRLIVRWGCLVAAVVLSLVNWQVVVPSMSPFVAVCSAVALRTVRAMTLIGLAVGGAMVFLPRRMFCRWVCPMGLCLGGCSKLGRKFGRRGWRRVRVGQWLLLATLAGAVLGMPLFLWLDPLAVFAAVFHLVDGQWALAFGLPLMALISFVWPNVWCGSLCPLGGLQDLLYDLRHRAGANAPEPTRRLLIAAGAGAAAASACRLTANERRVLRPPGAVEELSFGGLCLRCGNCMRVCPVDIVQADLGEGGIGSFLAPRLSFGRNYCKEDCVRCTAVCPSGALSKLTIEEKQSRPIGTPLFDMELCRLSTETECSDCSIACPYDAIRYEFDEDTYALAPVVDEERCNGCGACVIGCPVRPRAITIHPRR